MYNKLNVLKKAIENIKTYHKGKLIEEILKIELQREANLGSEPARDWIIDFEEQGYIQIDWTSKERIFKVCKDWEKPYEF